MKRGFRRHLCEIFVENGRLRNLYAVRVEPDPKETIWNEHP